MKAITEVVERADEFQQRHVPTAFAVGVQKKYGQDQAGKLCTQMTYTMFMTVFPLLLLLVTIVGIVLADHPAERERILNTAFGEFPLIGDQLEHNISALKRGSSFGLAIGIVGLIYGSTGLAQCGLFAMEQIRAIPLRDRPNFLVRLVRCLLFLVVLGVGLIVTTFLAGLGTFGRHNVALGYLAEILAAVVNVGLYLASFSVLTPKHIRPRQLYRGAIAGGIAWTVLQAVGAYFVGHVLKGASATYGAFGLVLGLMAWIALGARITLYAAEINTVLDGHRWPVPLRGGGTVAPGEVPDDDPAFAQARAQVTG